METKDELKKRLEELKTQLVGISKDAHFAKTIIDELLSVKGQLSIEPLELNVGKRIDDYKGETFEIVKTDRGALYHEYGGYNIFVKENNTALYSTLMDYVNNKAFYDTLDSEQQEQFSLQQSAVAYCLSVPKFCFADAEFTYEIASKVVDFLRSVYEKAMDEPLQEETIEDDEQFKEMALGLEQVKKAIKELAKEEKEEDA